MPPISAQNNAPPHKHQKMRATHEGNFLISDPVPKHGLVEPISAREERRYFLRVEGIELVVSFVEGLVVLVRGLRGRVCELEHLAEAGC